MMIPKFKLHVALVLSLLAVTPPGRAAEPLGAPVGPVVLTISGAIGVSNRDADADFDLAMLDALAQRETVTTTPWFDGPQTFSGPRLSDLLAAVGADGSTLRVSAINDYAVEIPMSDLAEYPVILASRQAGEVMSVRDKGPLFVVYPFDEVPSLVNEIHFSRSVWQVRRIDVLP